MDWLSKLFLEIVKFLHTFTGNYGWDIILLTVLVRVVMFPLTLTSIKSMKKMQELQPKIKDLQKKYKDDKEALNRELLDVYKKHGVNPVSGCLPMVIQFPIFIILYGLLRNPVANGYIFVNASFYGMDLTTAAFNRISTDFLGSLPLVLPGMVNLSSLGLGMFKNSYLYLPTLILVVFMTVTTFFQQKGMQMDKSQSSMFWYMNIFIVFISFSMPSGVLLYWCMSNFFQLLQQKLAPYPSAARAGKKNEEKEAKRSESPQRDEKPEEKKKNSKGKKKRKRKKRKR